MNCNVVIVIIQTLFNVSLTWNKVWKTIFLTISFLFTSKFFLTQTNAFKFLKNNGPLNFKNYLQYYKLISNYNRFLDTAITVSLTSNVYNRILYQSQWLVGDCWIVMGISVHSNGIPLNPSRHRTCQVTTQSSHTMLSSSGNEAQQTTPCKKYLWNGLAYLIFFLAAEDWEISLGRQNNTLLKSYIDEDLSKTKLSEHINRGANLKAHLTNTCLFYFTLQLYLPKLTGVVLWLCLTECNQASSFNSKIQMGICTVINIWMWYQWPNF